MPPATKNALEHLRPDYMPFSFRPVYEYQKNPMPANPIPVICPFVLQMYFPELGI